LNIEKRDKLGEKSSLDRERAKNDQLGYQISTIRPLIAAIEAKMFALKTATRDIGDMTKLVNFG
jgi:hypothetical protein